MMGKMFEVNGSTVKFKSGVSADYEQDQSLEFTLMATDPDGLTYYQEFYVDIINSNEAPVSISLDNFSVYENLSGGFIANISGVDPDEDNLTYSVLSDHDGEMFEVNGSTVKFKSGYQRTMSRINPLSLP